jgi:hypothetical protein
MKKLIFNCALAVSVLAGIPNVHAQTPWYNSSWNYRVALIIDHTKVSGTLTNFPILINITNSALQQYAQTNGNDILFTSADGTNKLSHEIESYTSSNGLLVAWVNVPILSSVADTNLYLYYGNSSATNQQNVAATWDSNFKGVWHMNNSFTDSTSNNNNGINTGTISATGKIANGRGFVRSNGVDYITISGLMGSSSNVTLSAWADLTSIDTKGAEIINLGDCVFMGQNNTNAFGGFYNGSNWSATPSSTNLIGTGWRYVAYTFDDAGHSQSLYVDGVQIGSSTFTNSISYAGLGANTIIGKQGNGGTGYSFDGMMDEVRVSSTSRSAGWIWTEFNNQNSPATFYSVGSPETKSPTITTQPTNQTVVAGGNVTFLVVAGGFGSLNYQWYFNGSAISGATATNYTLTGVMATDAGNYTVVITNLYGSVTSSVATLTVTKATGTVTLGSLSQTYSGSAEAATASTTPSGLAVTLTYNGLANAPTNAGSYTVIGTINDANYQGSATNTLVIAQAGATVTLGNLSQTYDGSAEAATASTTPSGLAVVLTYNGSANAPTNAGSYTVIGTINNANYQGSATNTLVISPATGVVTLGNLSQIYSGTAEAATATTTPTGLTVVLTYNGSVNAPTNAGSYTVIGTINNANYQGSATNTLVIAKGSANITFGGLNQTYTGTAEAATATTTPTGLTVMLTYNGSSNAPTNAGSYTVIGTINDANYQGSATNTLVISQASGTVTFSGLNQTYDGTAKAATASTTPSGLTVSFTYNGSANAPTNAGSYTVIGTINDANYQGNVTNMLVINKVTLTVTADNKTKIYGMPNPPLTASYNGFVGGENTNVLSSPVTLSTTATTTSGAGTYPITASGAAAANYMIQYVNGTLRVISAPQLAIASVSVDGTEQYAVSWQTITNQMYQLEYTADLNPPENWTPLGTPFAGIDGIIAVTNSMSVMPNCFFRVEVLEVQ